MSEGRLRVYLGAGPGVGKTYSLLSEAHRRLARGARVAVVLARDDEHPRTMALAEGLDLLDRTRLVEAPSVADVVFVDGLAAAADLVDRLLRAGIDVVSTVDVGQIRSQAASARARGGAENQTLVDDELLLGAEQVELVDITPEALRRRMVHGNVIAPSRDAFEPVVLAGLRDLALHWLASWSANRAARPEVSGGGRTEVVVVAVTGAPGNERLVRRAQELAGRSGASLHGVHVRTNREHHSLEALGEIRDRLLDGGGEFHEVLGERAADTLLRFSSEVGATQLVLGESRGSRWQQIREGAVVTEVVRRAGSLDLHIVRTGVGVPGRLPFGTGRQMPPTRLSVTRGPSLSVPRRRWGHVIAVVGVPVLTLFALASEAVDPLGTSVPLLFVALVTTVAIVGGRRPALIAASGACLATTYFFTPPRYTFSFATRDDVIDVGVLLLVAFAVGTVVSRLAERDEASNQARAEAELLALATQGVPAEMVEVEALLEGIRAVIAANGVAILQGTDTRVPACVASAGTPNVVGAAGSLSLPLDGDASLVVGFGPFSTDQRRILQAVAAQLAASLERDRLVEEGASLVVHEETDRLRTAILRSVSHDLRTPLASIKAASSSLLQSDVQWSSGQRDRFVQAIDQKADHLEQMVANLLDLSRLEAGGVERNLQPVGIDDVLPQVLAGIDDHWQGRLVIEVPDDLPRWHADPVLVERVLANVVGNALVHTSGHVRLEASVVRDRLLIRVIDHGPGVPPTMRNDVLLPFHRLSDASDRRPPGAGLGLAVAHGFVGSMNGELRLDDTPGGGLTVTLTLPLSVAA